MVARITTVFAISLLLLGCASTEMSAEEKRQLEQDIRAYNAEVIAPVMSLNYMYCTEYKNNKKWPNAPSVSGPASPFSSIAVKNNSLQPRLDFRLKSSSLKWAFEAKLINKNGEQHCETRVTAGHEDPPNALKMELSSPISEIDEKQWSGRSFTEFADSTLPFTAAYYPFLQLMEKSRPRASDNKRGEFYAFMSEALVKFTVCALFDVEPDLCT